LLLAHLVPGYFASTYSQKTWRDEWSFRQRTLLWFAAFVSTFAPDLDVIYNALFRGFINHSTLWTHSLFVHLSIGLCWIILRYFRHLAYLQTLVGLIAIGGLSHLALDVISHSTPLLYPISTTMIGSELIPARVLQGGFWAYITDPIFLLEPLLIALMIGHWVLQQKFADRTKHLLLIGLVNSLAIFVGLFLWFLPTIQSKVIP
jgi:hypothetical protein